MRGSQAELNVFSGSAKARMLNTIRENAKWFVAVPIACFAALIFVDWGMSPGNDMTQKNVVGKVDGEKISFASFDKEVEAEAKKLTGEGQELDAGQYANIRAEVFEKIARSLILNKQFEVYGLEGSPLEVLTFFKMNPPPGAEKAPIFMGPDSQFSRTKYLQWLSNPKVFDDPYMRMMEEQASKQILPEKQMGVLVAAAQPVSDLELLFRLRMDRPRMWGVVVTASADSFRVEPASVTAAQAKAWFDGHLDTLWHSKKAAVLPYVAFDKAPTRADSIQSKGQIDSVAMLARSGEKFEDLARNYSEDPGSAKQGGDLGGFQSLKNWVPEFAAAVRKLDSGKISDPVATRFGWHVIKCKGRKIENGDTLYSLAHVLVTVQISPESIDALKARAETFRKLVKSGKSLEEAAKAVGSKVEHTFPIEEGVLSVALPSGFIAGLGNFAFRDDATVSEVLESPKTVVVAGRGKIYPPGHDFDLVLSVAQERAAHEQAVQKAKAWIDQHASAIAACDTSSACIKGLGKLTSSVYIGRPRGAFLPGFGYALPEFLKLTHSSARHGWSGSVSSAPGAMMVRVDSLVDMTPAEMQQELPTGRLYAKRARAGRSFASWYDWCRSLAKVDNHLDRYFRD